MKGITNAPQGSGGGSGGAWMERANNNNWGDIFKIDGSYVEALKDLYVTYNADKVYIPKGYRAYSSISMPLTAVGISSNKIVKQVSMTLMKNTSSITDPYISKTSKEISFTTDGSTVSVSEATSTNNVLKADITIWTRD